MLKLTIKGEEYFNEALEEFIEFDSVVIELEHSLISLSKWESKYQKPFLVSGSKSPEEVFDYLKAMLVTPNVDPDVLEKCSPENLTEIQEYIDSKQSATTIQSRPNRRGPQEVITSELIYYWMTGFNIPFEAETWHLNRLFSLLQICNVKNGKKTKMSKAEVARQNRQLNAERRQQLGTTG